MVDLQLYINNIRVDLYKDETLQINDSIQSSKSFASILSGYSETYTLPATNNNNEIFKHYYNYELNNGFNANIRQRALIKVNGVDKYFGYIQLQSVSLENNTAKNYKVIFTSFIAILKQKIKDDSLRNVYNLNRIGVFTDIITGDRKLNLTSNLCYPVKDAVTGENELTTTTDYNEATICNALMFSENYAFDGTEWIDDDGLTVLLSRQRYDSYSVRAILKAIFEYYGLDVDMSFFETAPANELFLYGQPSKSVVDPEDREPFFNIYYLKSTDLTFNSGTNVLSNNGILTVNDNESKTIRFYVESENFTSGDTCRIIIRDRLSGQNLYDETQEISGFIDPEDGLTDRQGTVGTVELLGVRNYDLQFIALQSNNRAVLKNNYVRIDDNLYDCEIPTIVSKQPLYFMPDIGVIDFIDSVLKLYNLTLYENSSGQVVIQTLDDFYNSGVSKDLTPFIDISKSDIKPVEGFSEIIFQYKESETAAIQLQNALSEDGYGNLKFKDKTSVNNNSYKVEPVFNLILPERLDTTGGDSVIVGRNIDDDGKEVFNDALIFYVKQRTSDNTGFTGLTTYNSISNVASDDTTLFYGIDNDVDGDRKDNSLFLTYFSKYVTSVYDNKSRLFEVDAYLPSDYIQEYSLNDNIIINNREFRIENISVNVNTGKSKLTLNNIPQIDDSINLFLNLLANNRVIFNDGATFNVSVTSNTSWQFTDVASWITFTPSSGFGNQIVSVTVAANTGADRSDVIKLTGEGVSTIEYRIRQVAPPPPSSLSISPTSASVDFNAQDILLTITSNTDWGFTTSDNWINPPVIFPQTGNASGNVSVDQNNDASSRSGSLTVQTDDGTVTEVLSITQGGFTAPTTYAFVLGFGSTSLQACSQNFTNTFYTDNPVFENSTKIWTDAGGSNLANAQFYSDGVKHLQFDGTNVTKVGSC